LRSLGEHNIQIRLTVDLVPEVMVNVIREGTEPEKVIIQEPVSLPSDKGQEELEAEEQTKPTSEVEEPEDEEVSEPTSEEELEDEGLSEPTREVEELEAEEQSESTSEVEDPEDEEQAEPTSEVEELENQPESVVKEESVEE